MKRFIIALSITVVLFTNIVNVSADIGPKPSIEIIVKGIDEIYYLDLLSDESSYGSGDEFYLSLSPETQAAVKSLREYEDEDGYTLHMLNDQTPVHVGNILGEKQSDGSYYNYFSYRVPNTFKIIILRENKDIIITEIISRELFNSKITIDLSGSTNYTVIDSENNVYKLNEVIKEDIPIQKTITGLIVRLVLTILVEFLIAYYIFKFRSMKTLKVIVLVNLFTQLALNMALFKSVHIFYILILFIFIEPIIFLVEGAIYSIFIKGISKKILWLYALLANLVTGILTIFVQ
ncbi:hypothetical protein RJG79_10455 [Mycoplasmatota bacterium WC44]